ncbi:MAG: hypothetical protein RL324_2426 [Verrucomicrobiota bacterium]|jgi:hypothetical protein
MAIEFPFVQIPAKDAKSVGKRDPETRVYRREGSREEVGEWFDTVLRITGPNVSPGGVCMYADVSRAAVYKAINEGRLTAFGFHVISESRSVLGFKKRTRELPYIYIPVSEAKAWGEIIAEKIKAKALTREDEPGWIESDRDYFKITAGIEHGKYPKKKAKK